MDSKKISKMSKESIEKLNKESKIILFLIESKNIKSREEIKDLYVNKYKLNNKSNDVNIRVIERFLGVYSKYSNERKKEKVDLLKSELIKINVSYESLINLMKGVKNKVKRSNKLNEMIDLKELII